MERRAVSLCSSCDHCPEVVIEGDEVRIGEEANTAVLTKAEWNVLVDLIQAGLALYSPGSPRGVRVTICRARGGVGSPTWESVRIDGE